MKVDRDFQSITLSRRNLRQLVNQLDNPEMRQAAVYREGWYILAEEDEQHYAGRKDPDAVHPSLEAFS